MSNKPLQLKQLVMVYSSPQVALECKLLCAAVKRQLPCASHHLSLFRNLLFTVAKVSSNLLFNKIRFLESTIHIKYYWSNFSLKSWWIWISVNDNNISWFNSWIDVIKLTDNWIWFNWIWFNWIRFVVITLIHKKNSY